MLTGGALAGKTLGFGSTAVTVAFVAASIAIPAAFTVGLVRSRRVRGAVANAVVELGRTAALGGLRDSLARALHDPSLALVHWQLAEQRFVDRNGRVGELPGSEDRRAVTIVERDGCRVGALVHDPSLRDDDELVAAVASAAGLALEIGTSGARRATRSAGAISTTARSSGLSRRRWRSAWPTSGGMPIRRRRGRRSRWREIDWSRRWGNCGS